MIYDIVLIICFISMGYYVATIYAASRFFSRTHDTDPTFHPPITLLKPVCGLEESSYDNFASFCRQDYPEYEIIFGVHDPHDPIIQVINQLIKDYPTINIQLVICDQSLGANPKINNLIQMQAKARYSFLLMSDSDIGVGPNYLQKMIQPMKDQAVGATTSLYRSIAKTWVTIFEAIKNATEAVPGLLFVSQLPCTCLVGWSILVRLSVLEEIGGLQAIKDYVGEDFLMGRLIVNKNYHIIISNYIVENTLQSESFSKIIQRHVRWGKGILLHSLPSYISMLLMYGTVTSFIFLLITHGSKIGWVVFFMSWITRFFMVKIIGDTYLQDEHMKNLFWIAPILDFASFLIWLYAFFPKKIYWRGKYFKLVSNGKIELIN